MAEITVARNHVFRIDRKMNFLLGIGRMYSTKVAINYGINKNHNFPDEEYNLPEKECYLNQCAALSVHRFCLLTDISHVYRTEPKKVRKKT